MDTGLTGQNWLTGCVVERQGGLVSVSRPEAGGAVMFIRPDWGAGDDDYLATLVVSDRVRKKFLGVSDLQLAIAHIIQSHGRIKPVMVDVEMGGSQDLPGHQKLGEVLFTLSIYIAPAAIGVYSQYFPRAEMLKRTGTKPLGVGFFYLEDSFTQFMSFLADGGGVLAGAQLGLAQ